MTFKQAVERTLEKKENELRNDKHRKQCCSTLVFLVPTGQLTTPFAADRLSRAVAGLPSPADRVRHLFGHRQEATCLTC